MSWYKRLTLIEYHSKKELRMNWNGYDNPILIRTRVNSLKWDAFMREVNPDPMMPNASKVFIMKRRGMFDTYVSGFTTFILNRRKYQMFRGPRQTDRIEITFRILNNLEFIEKISLPQTPSNPLQNP